MNTPQLHDVAATPPKKDKAQKKDKAKKNQEIKNLLTSANTEIGAQLAVYREQQEKFNLVSKILSARPEKNVSLEKFKSIIKEDFIKFANVESSLAAEAEAILQLQSIEQELEVITSFPRIYSKTIIAIGGGFSSGKSAFVNSFINHSNIKLPIGIEPVTAIPSYIVADVTDSIKGFAKNGGTVDIAPELYAKISHQFVKSFDFNIKDIMPFMAIGTTMNQEYLQNICLIDTPGYNPAQTNGYTREDKKTASDYLNQANALIWMIGLDANGTIPNSDLNFLSELDLTGKQLYIVANKADLKPMSEITDIIDEIESCVNDADIELAGICAYSANCQKEYYNKKMSLLDFLESQNQPLIMQDDILARLDKIFSMYKNAIANDVKAGEKYISNLHSLELDLLESGCALDSTSGLSKKIEILKKSNVFNIEELNQQLTSLSTIRETMRALLCEIFSKSTDHESQTMGKEAGTKNTKAQVAQEKQQSSELISRLFGIMHQRMSEKQFVIPGWDIKFVYVAPGNFKMGSNEYTDEQPVHLVTLSNEYWIGKHQVTQNEYQAIIGSNPSYFKGGKKPVESVSWNDAVSFCQKLTERERTAGRLPAGYEYRLPTEAEWEFAARGGIASKGYTYSGSNTLDSVAWYEHNSRFQTHDVGTKSPNELGIYDMSGNAWEWCYDFWHGDYYGAPADGKLWCDCGYYRVRRGGGWNNCAGRCRVAERSSNSPGNGDNSIGFRVALAPVQRNASDHSIFHFFLASM